MLTAAEWLPDSEGLLPAGQWWDAVKVTRILGEAALARLGAGSGAVVEDRAAHLLYWLVSPGSADGWPPMAQVEVLGTACHVGVPARPGMAGAGCPRLTWRVLPVGDGLTDAGVLRAALEVAAR